MRGKQGKGNWNNADAWKNRQIQAGDSGIWATCDKGREGKCIAELRDLFGSYAEEVYSQQLAAEQSMDDGDAMDLDLEASIKAEVEGIKRPTQEPLFTPIKLDVQCGKLLTSLHNSLYLHPPSSYMESKGYSYYW